MIVLLTGATGFVGRHLLAALLAAGHEVRCTTHRPQSDLRFVLADFSRDFDPAVWWPRLSGVDVVVNCVGIFRERGAQTFDALHVRAPHALFSACLKAGVPRVIQLSALGADQHAVSRYHRSKKQADDYLSRLPLSWTIVQPSLIYGTGGTSASLFTLLASLPWIPLPGSGEQFVQPVHVDDVVAVLVSLIESESEQHTRVPIVGPAPVTLRDFLGRLRVALDAGRPRYAEFPMPIVRLAARIGARLPGSLLDTESLGMLMRGNTADPSATTRLLGHPPKPVESFVPAEDADLLRTQAKLRWLLPVLRWSIALVWIVTGIVSFGLYPTAASYELLARTGVTGPLAPLFLYGAAALDLAFGIGTLLLPATQRRRLWTLQIALIVSYTLIISVRLPEFWIHPYGPILKNLPLLAAIWLLRELEPLVRRA